MIDGIYCKASGGDAMPEKPKKGHTTGIGITNVIQRLRLYFKKDDIIDISSVKGEGTRIVIRIPA